MELNNLWFVCDKCGTAYDDNLEERQLFEVKQEIKKLINELDNSKLGIINEENETQ